LLFSHLDGCRGEEPADEQHGDPRKILQGGASSDGGGGGGDDDGSSLLRLLLDPQTFAARQSEGEGEGMSVGAMPGTSDGAGLVAAHKAPKCLIMWLRFPVSNESRSIQWRASLHPAPAGRTPGQSQQWQHHTHWCPSLHATAI